MLIIAIDDMGYSDLSAFGGEINTPNIDKLAKQGTRYTRFHASSLSAATRSMLMTGVDNHLNGIGAMPPTATTSQYLQPGYEGALNSRVATVAEMLKEQSGYHTFMVGKWHLGAKDDTCPSARGFDKCFTLLAGGASHFANGYALFDYEVPVTFYHNDGKRVDKLPDDFYSTRSYTEYALDYIENAPEDQPIFGYISMTAPHDPLHIIEEWSDKYKAVYDKGYDEIRKARHQRQIELGLIPASTPFYPIEARWEDLSAAQQREQARTMEIYAAMIDYLDYSIGQIIDGLKRSGRYDDTLIFVISDNGANSKRSDEYPGNGGDYMSKNYNNSLDNYGNADSFIAQGKAWACVSNNPFSGYKETMNEGGNWTPLIIAGGAFNRSMIDSESLIHVADIVPTILAQAGAEYSFAGRDLAPLYGRVIDPQGVDVRGENDVVCFEIDGCKSVIRGFWKAMVNSSHNGGDGVTWSLYNLKDDIAEMNDLSAKYPDMKKELVDLWNKYAGEVGYVEANDVAAMSKLTAEEYYSFDPKNIKTV